MPIPKPDPNRPPRKQSNNLPHLGYRTVFEMTTIVMGLGNRRRQVNVVASSHDQSPWSASQRKDYDTQRYALAVEIADETRSDIDLYALIRARLSQRLRVGRPPVAHDSGWIVADFLWTQTRTFRSHTPSDLRKRARSVVPGVRRPVRLALLEELVAALRASSVM